ncbi:hypothetical protein AAVH_17012 [Aphelenchoides avenae]|nr:hypothetical protein AAVH_17012 [Aphelenchus avenae]
MDSRYLVDTTNTYDVRSLLHEAQELQRLCKTGQDLADKCSLTFLECQKRAVELTGKLMHQTIAARQPPVPWCPEAPKSEPQPSTSYSSTGSPAETLSQWQLRQILGTLPTNVPHAEHNTCFGIGSADFGTLQFAASANPSSSVEVAEQLQPADTASVNNTSTRKRRSTDTGTGATKQPKEEKLGITFEELRGHISNLSNLRDEASGDFKCPVCDRVAKHQRIRHLLEHLTEKAYHPFKCPVEDCELTGVRIDNVQRHAVTVHKLVWTLELIRNMNFRHFLDTSQPLGAPRLPQDYKLELQQLRTRRRELADKWMIECSRYHSQLTEIQQREEEILDELLRQPADDQGASFSMQCKAESPAIPSAYKEDSTELPFTNWQLQQLLNRFDGSVPGTGVGPGPHAGDDASREAASAVTMKPSGTPEMQPTGSLAVASSESSKRPSVPGGDTSKAKKKKLDGITFEQLSQYVANIATLCDETTGDFKCPVCGRVKKESKFNSLRHLLEHLSEKEYHPYKCPVDGCATTSVRSDVVRVHVVNVHKLEWTDELKAASADAEKKAVLDWMLKERK